MSDINSVIVRGACWMTFLLVLFAITIVLDMWRIERKIGKPLSALALLVLSVTLLSIGIVFIKCAWTGRFPESVHERCP